MNYENQFRKKEETFRPFNKYKHEDVIDRLAEIPAKADKELSTMYIVSLVSCAIAIGSLVTLMVLTY